MGTSGPINTELQSTFTCPEAPAEAVYVQEMAIHKKNRPPMDLKHPLRSAMRDLSLNLYFRTQNNKTPNEALNRG